MMRKSLSGRGEEGEKEDEEGGWSFGRIPE